MDWWGIALILVVGIAVVVCGYLDDRRKTRERDAAMTAPPKREIPRFAPQAEPPQYLSELEARTRPAGLPATALTDRQRTDLTTILESAPSIKTGILDDRFITDAASGWAVASDPLVALCADPVVTVRELLPLLEKAQRAGRPLTIAAPEFSAEAIDTLAANTIRRKVQCIPIVVTADQSAQLKEYTLAAPLARADLQAGWAPDDSLGTTTTWVSSRKRSWVVQPSE